VSSIREYVKHLASPQTRQATEALFISWDVRARRRHIVIADKAIGLSQVLLLHEDDSFIQVVCCQNRYIVGVYEK